MWGGLGKTSRFAPTVSVPAQRGQTQARQPSSSETGVEHLYQVSADVMRMWCSSVGMDISQVPPPVESSVDLEHHRCLLFIVEQA